MVNINTIKTIEDAKKGKYNDKELTSDEKSIFDNPLLSIVNRWGKHDLTEIHETALLLDDVKRAEKAELSDGLATVNDLLNAIKKAKENKTTAYQVVNSYNRLVDEAINRLGGLSKDEITQGVAAKGRFKARNFTMDEAKISATDGSNKTQGIKGGDDVELEGDFVVSNLEIKVDAKQVARTEKEIELEITNKKKSLARKEKMLDTYIEKGNDEKMEQVEKEITKLEGEISKLELEKEQVAQIQTDPK